MDPMSTAGGDVMMYAVQHCTVATHSDQEEASAIHQYMHACHLVACQQSPCHAMVTPESTLHALPCLIVAGPLECSMTSTL